MYIIKKSAADDRVYSQQFFNACENAIHYERTSQNISRVTARIKARNPAFAENEITIFHIHFIFLSLVKKIVMKHGFSILKLMSLLLMKTRIRKKIIILLFGRTS